MPLRQDDLYVGMTMAETMDRLGFDATVEQYGEAFRDSQYDLWHANAGARRLLNLGIKAPMSGHPKYNIHANDIDFQIEADFIGLMSPGLPRESNKYCDRVGRVMNHGDGLYGGMFVSGMYTAAFFERDVRKVVAQGLACLPPESGYARIIRDVLDWSAKYPDDWKTDVAARRGQVGYGGLVSGRRAQALQHRRADQRRVYRPGPAVRRAGLRQDARDRDAIRPGLGLQSVDRGRHPRRHARLQRDSRRLEARHSAAGRQEVRVHADRRSTTSAARRWSGR